VLTAELAPVLTSVSLTVAPGTTAPVESRTVPRISPAKD
jgi:hypothetical protein